MIKVTPLRIITDEVPDEYGTGREKGLEIVPFTVTAMDRISPNFAVPPTPGPITGDNLDETDLRPYQIEDVRLLANRNVGVILSEPRTGKTPTAILTFLTKGVKKYIVVAPASILYQWSEEITRWSGASVVVAGGTVKKRHQMYKDWEDGVLVISYETLRNDVEIILKTNKDIEGVILDEAHKIKNNKSLQYLAAYKLRKVKHKLALTGTLAPNKSHEVYGVLSFSYPQIFTGYWRFIYYYFETEERVRWVAGKKGQSFNDIGGLKHPTELQEFLERVAVRRTQKEVMPWLPEKDYVKIRLDCTKDQKIAIEEMMEFFETGDVIAENLLTQLLRVRQICNAPQLLDLKGKSPKMEWIKQYIKDFPEKSIVIFSSFTSFLKLLKEEIPDSHLIIGETKIAERNVLKNLFQKGKIKILLVNTQAGKEGLTLDQASCAIFCDNYPPASDIIQAENRITATTEDKSDKENTIIKLMMKETYDEALYDLVENNLEETDVINNFKQYLQQRRKGQ